MKSRTSHLNLSANNPFLILNYSKQTFTQNSLKIIVRIREWRKSCGFAPWCISGHVRGWAAAWIKALNKSAVMQSLTSSRSQLATALIGWHRTGLLSWAEFIIWILAGHSVPWWWIDISDTAIGCHVLCGPEGLSSSCRSRCWFIFFPDYLCISSAASESKYSAHQLPRAANSTAGFQGYSPRGTFTLSFRFSVLHCQLLSVHS